MMHKQHAANGEVFLKFAIQILYSMVVPYINDHEELGFMSPPRFSFMTACLDLKFLQLNLLLHNLLDTYLLTDAFNQT